MENKVFISLTVEEFKSLIVDSVRKCLQGLIHVKSDITCESEELLTIKQASKLLDLKVSCIYGMTHRKEIPFMKPEGSKRLYFSKQSLIEWIQKGRRKTNTEIEEEAIKFQIGKQKGGVK